MSDLSNSEDSARRKFAEQLACKSLRPGLVEPPAATCLLLPTPGFSGRRAAVGPQYPAGPGRSEVMEVAPLSPSQVAARSPGLVSEEAGAMGCVRPKSWRTRVSGPTQRLTPPIPAPRSGQDPSLKGRVDLMGSMEMWTLRNAWCKPEYGGPGRGGSHPAGSWLSGREQR